MKPARVSVDESLMLIPPTPPCAQVEFSKNQIVVVLSEMGTSYVVIDVPLFAGRGPVLKPFNVTLWSCAGTQGASNVDWMRSYVPFVTAREVSVYCHATTRCNCVESGVRDNGCSDG